MNQDLFEETLRKYLRRKPFYPFLVERLDGTAVMIEQPTIAMGGGAATYLTEQEFIEFACEEVRAIRTAPAEALP